MQFQELFKINRKDLIKSNYGKKFQTQVYEKGINR